MHLSKSKDKVKVPTQIRIPYYTRIGEAISYLNEIREIDPDAVVLGNADSGVTVFYKRPETDSEYDQRMKDQTPEPRMWTGILR